MRRFSKVLIANRGEVAVRVLRTLKAWGIPGVAVYHEADRETPAVRNADEAEELLGATPVGAYLDADGIVAACRRTGADAVHPGFGFLSENAEFARRLEREGITFIGPDAYAIAAMGDKIAAKRLARQAGLTTVPGFAGEVEDPAHAMEVARRIGYPVMIKAAAGGGGKGMRVARTDRECREGYERASREARSSFGDPRVLVEAYLKRPRHIEVQVLGDGHGNVVHLGERECSIQRRHQKVIEESPSPFLDQETRTRMGEQAVALARAVGYRSAGTVEFIVDQERNFYFLEMNARLQVEHPVTELVTGLDLVGEQIRVAQGEPLNYRQEDLAMSGHAVECRICAEDADEGFVPCTGEVSVWVPPGGEGVRVDSGVEQGMRVTSAFDPMLAKLITHGPSREEAVRRARQALAEIVLLGVTTNLAFLDRVLAHESFGRGDLHTGFLEEHADSLRRPDPPAEQIAAVLAAGCLSSSLFTDPRYRALAPLSGMGHWRN